MQAKFLPIAIWWELSNTIPIRPGEFTIIRYDCISFNSKENKYYIEIPRIKNRVQLDEDLISFIEIEPQVLPVSTEVVKLIELYKKYHGILNLTLVSSQMEEKER